MNVQCDRLMAAQMVVIHPDATVELRGRKAVAMFGPGGEYVHEYEPRPADPNERLPRWVLPAVIVAAVIVIGLL